MEIIKHRINQISQLATLAPNHGAEIDIRSKNGALVLQHEPHLDGDLLSDYLKEYARTPRTGLLILNVKEDGLEGEIINLLNRNSIQRYFFLDMAMPTLVKQSIKLKNSRLALRVSEYEPIAATAPFQEWVDWVWLDTFSGAPPEKKLIQSLKKYFKVCLVSPELQGYPKETIQQFKHLTDDLDAVCTKHETFWQSI